LRKRGWENCGLCPLCKQTEETNNHLFVHCRFTARIWELLRDWLGIRGIQPQDWGGGGGDGHSTLVGHFGGRVESFSEGSCFPCLAHRVGNLARAQ
jgi:hypothetical protein